MIFIFAIVVAAIFGVVTFILAADPEGRGGRYIRWALIVFAVSLAVALASAVQWCLA